MRIDFARVCDPHLAEVLGTKELRTLFYLLASRFPTCIISRFSQLLIEGHHASYLTTRAFLNT